MAGTGSRSDTGGGKRPRGRPSNADAGEVEERILQAAAALFVANGYEGTSFEQIAVAARAGKATIYARYASKEGLFSAVIRRDIERSLKLVESAPPHSGPDRRLQHVLRGVVVQSLSPDAIALTRVVIAEASRFPALVRLVDEHGRQRAIGLIADVLATDTPLESQSDQATAEMLLELTFVPLMFRALMGEPLFSLQSEVEGRVKRAIATLRAVEKHAG